MMRKAVFRMGEKLGAKAFQVGDKVGYFAPGYQKINWIFDVVSICSDKKIKVWIEMAITSFIQHPALIIQVIALYGRIIKSKSNIKHTNNDSSTFI